MPQIKIGAAKVAREMVLLFFTQREAFKNVFSQILECLEKAQYLNISEVDKTGVLKFGRPLRMRDPRVTNHSGLPPEPRIFSFKTRVVLGKSE